MTTPAADVLARLAVAVKGDDAALREFSRWLSEAALDGVDDEAANDVVQRVFLIQCEADYYRRDLWAGQFRDMVEDLLMGYRVGLAAERPRIETGTEGVTVNVPSLSSGGLPAFFGPIS